MMKEYPNFYETLKEAKMRLEHTIVLYDGVPHYIWCITNHKPDGIFRVYMEPLNNENGNAVNRIGGVPYDHPDDIRGDNMDKWMEKHSDGGIIRKMMNSPMFNKFRPFELGMCNYRGNAVYVQRQPRRETNQGLTEGMLHCTPIELVPSAPGARRIGPSVPSFGPQIHNCIMGVYPTIQECLVNLADPKCANNSVAFHRQFAILRGPLLTLYLSYKGQLIGFIPGSDTSVVRLDKEFAYVKEVVEATKVFDKIELGSN